MNLRAVVLGGGVGGIVVANGLARRNGDVEILVVDGHGDHIYQPGLLHVPTGKKTVEGLTRDLRPLLRRRVGLEVRRASRIDPESRVLELEGGHQILFDFLVLATGSRVAPQLLPGFRDGALHFHCPRRAVALRESLLRFTGGNIVIGATRLPYKCPLSPVEMALLLDEHLERDGRRKRTRIHLVHPAARLSQIDAVADMLEALVVERGIELHLAFEVAAVDPEGRSVESTSGARLSFDLPILVPPHTVAPVLRESGLVAESGFVPTDPATLRVAEGIYAVGDNADLPSPKLGSAAMRQAAVVVENLLAEAAGRPPPAAYEGGALCFVETGRGRAALVETDYRGVVDVRAPGRRNFLKKRLLNRIYFQYVSRQ